MTYDDRGNVLTRKNGLNQTWTFTYNSFNEVLTEIDPLNRTTTYAYNASGNLTSITNAKRLRRTGGAEMGGLSCRREETNRKREADKRR